METDASRERALRRMAQRQGLQLIKSRRRDPQCYDYGTYALADPNNNTLVAYDCSGGLSLDEIEAALNE
jgi:hypothetical protein